MIAPFLKRSRNIAAAGAILLCTGTSAWAGLFCDWYVQPMRPHFSPECEPNFGYHPTTWKQFPAMAESGDYCPSCQTGAEMGSEMWQTDSSAAPIGNPSAESPHQNVPQYQNIPMQHAQPQVFGPPMTYETQPNSPYPAGTPSYNGNSSPMMSPGLVVPHESQPVYQGQQNSTSPMQPGPQPSVGTPVPMDGTKTLPGQPNTLTPKPNNQPSNSQQFKPVPMPEGSLPTPMEMPPLPDQTGLQRYRNSRPTAFSGTRVPVEIQMNQPNRVFNGRLAYGRYGGPIPPYQQPQNGQAQPLVLNSSQPSGTPVQGISFSREVDGSESQSQESVPVTGYRRWLRMPRLPSWGR